MKKWLSIAFVVFCCNMVPAQTLPDAVSSAFEAKFPKAKKVKWTPEDVNEYAAYFENDSLTVIALFEGDGKWINTSIDVPLPKLPLTLTAALKKKYPKSKINHAARVTHYKKGQYYEIEMKTKDKVETFYFDQDGNEVR